MRAHAVRGFLGMTMLVVFYITIASFSLSVTYASEKVVDTARSPSTSFTSPPQDRELSFRTMPIHDDKKFTKALLQNMKVLGKILKTKHKLDVAFLREERQLNKTKATTTTNGTSTDPPDSAIVRKRRIGKRMLDDLENGILEKGQQLSELMRNLSDASMKVNLQHRLENLQDRSLRAKDDLDDLLTIEQEEDDIEKITKKHNNTDINNIVGGLVDNIDSELGKAINAIKADQREGAAFNKARDSKDHTVETVMKMDSRPHSIFTFYDDNKDKEKTHTIASMSTLIDHENNQYVLSRPHDMSTHYEDKLFAQDIAQIVIFSFTLSMVARLLGLPHFFGFIAAGCLLSPSELNRINSVVQVEVLARYGVCLMLFLLAIEFDYDKLARVWRTAVLGGAALSGIIIVASTLVLHFVFYAPAAEGVVLGFCFSLSSTAVAMRCLTEQRNEVPQTVQRVLIGVLVMQDVFLGVMVAVIPNLRGLGTDSGVSSVVSVLKPIASLIVLGVFVVVGLQQCAAPLARRIAGERELFLMFLLSFAFVLMETSEEIGLSAEVGAFLAGLAFSTDPAVQELSLEVLKPVQDFFVCFFFAGIGLHMYPAFLLREMALLLSLTLLVVCSKYVVGLLLFKQVCGMDVQESSLVALGLSQMSEFSFVVAAHGKAQGLISNEMYFMLLGTTALSLPTTPLLWRLHDAVERYED